LSRFGEVTPTTEMITGYSPTRLQEYLAPALFQKGSTPGAPVTGLNLGDAGVSGFTPAAQFGVLQQVEKREITPVDVEKKGLQGIFLPEKKIEEQPTFSITIPKDTSVTILDDQKFDAFKNKPEVVAAKQSILDFCKNRTTI